MQINVNARHLDLTPPIETYARTKAGKLTRFFDRIQQVNLLIDRGKRGYDVEIIAEVEHHDPFVATSSAYDPYAGIDLAMDKAVRQLTDHKTKLRNPKHPQDAARESAA